MTPKEEEKLIKEFEDTEAELKKEQKERLKKSSARMVDVGKVMEQTTISNSEKLQATAIVASGIVAGLTTNIGALASSDVIASQAIEIVELIIKKLNQK